MQASEMRKNFFNKYVADFDTNLYKTMEERDWSFIAKREYRWDVVYRSIAYSLMTANAVGLWRMFANKKMVFWPYLLVTPVAYLYWKPIFFQQHNKKLFDMCNV
jgi:hypothetical protein